VVTVGQTNCYANALKAVGTWEDAADENGNDWQRTKNVLDELTTLPSRRDKRSAHPGD